MSDDSAQELLSAVEDAPMTLNSGELVETVASRTTTIPRGDIEDIMATLFSLYSLRARLGLPPPDIADDIARAVEDSDLEELGAPEDHEHFKKRLTKLLDVNSLYLAARANNLRFENEHSLSQTRILTDTRPIFGPDPADGPEAAVITHTLRISYLDADNRYKDFLVALDGADIRALMAQLERAKSKAESLKSVLAAADVFYLDIE
ncbi:MAG: hypothetical protein LC781_08560 [Actinobacteria bacterium]|nr:hypothetical protein [Actinomycetota bacterium]